MSRLPLPAGPLAGLILDFTLRSRGVDAATAHCAAVTLWCAIWWMFQALPMAATSLVPAAAFPLLGVLSHREVSSSYASSIVLLMMAGSMMSAAMEKCDAHRRLAVGMVRMIGAGSGKRLVFGFMMASAVLSMWISNTATVLMLLPVAMAVLKSAGDRRSELSAPLLLAVAYAASVGGSGVPIGTPPNLILMDQYEKATGEELSFVGWMKLALPAVAAMLPIVWLWLSRRLRGPIQLQLPKLHAWKRSEIMTLTVFGLTALAWMTRKDPFGGWSTLLGVRESVGDSTVALVAAVALFALPNGEPQRGRLLDWQAARGIPWDILLMMGGGLAIGQAFQATALSSLLGAKLAPLAQWSLPLAACVLCLLCTFLTEITSNTAVANVMVPILVSASQQAGTDPLRLMLPATLGLNFAFMLPVATAPNALVFGAGVPLKTMAREGFALNLIGSVVVAGIVTLLLS